MKSIIRIKHAYILWIGCLLTAATHAQQDPGYTQYMYNTMVVNPGYAGSAGVLEGTLLHRSQWTGIDGAPQTQSLTIDSPLSNEKIGIGLSVVNDKLGPSNELSLDANVSYTISFSHDTKLVFGAKAGIRSMSVDWSKGRYYDDVDALLNNNISKTKPSVGAGLYLYQDKWYAGISVPSFLRSEYYDDIQEAVLSDRLHYYAIAGYVFDIGDNLKLKPAVLGKFVSGAPVTVDLSLNALIMEKLTAGVSHRFDDSVSALVGFQITPGLFAGYSFDYTTTRLNKYADGTHEIILRFQMQKKASQIKSPRFF
ncbi:PorP/SprF family type IX secretion system membrane protein [Flavobacterium caeni]|uniref:Type IX secretion system membrane protein, PorP/SprF family n=1 Tax=Flavobacterium caeni TaxID=490189 RepID=A0A1G5BE22_9FLAO|nr:type IX secretion system membrane protein PorP/SprF [Flavobacterium caeni]SCX88377.1 type IX secretion system membrane protein, PorP/SprF family [Flavobacterium caeni]